MDILQDKVWYFCVISLTVSMVCQTFLCTTCMARRVYNITCLYLSLPLFPFIMGEVLSATFSPPHLLFFSTLLCLLLPVSLLSCLLHISLYTVLPSQSWPPSSPTAMLTYLCRSLRLSFIGHPFYVYCPL